MSCLISSINYCPVKSLSFQNIDSCEIKKDLGILNDRMFAFSRGVDSEKAQLIEKKPNENIKPLYTPNYFVIVKLRPIP